MATHKDDKKTELVRQTWDLRQKCWSQESIAKKLGISQPTVARYLREITQAYGAVIVEERVRSQSPKSPS